MKRGLDENAVVDENTHSVYWRRTRQRENCLNIADLPDDIIQIIMDHLGGCNLCHFSLNTGIDEEPIEVRKDRIFPCNPALTNFAFSSRKFSRLFREEWVEKLVVDATLRATNQAVFYKEVLTGGLSRFPRAVTINIGGLGYRYIDGVDYAYKWKIPGNRMELVSYAYKWKFFATGNRIELGPRDNRTTAEAFACGNGKGDYGKNIKCLNFVRHAFTANHGNLRSMPITTTCPEDILGQQGSWHEYFPNASKVLVECPSSLPTIVKHVDSGSFDHRSESWTSIRIMMLATNQLRSQVTSTFPDNAVFLEGLRNLEECIFSDFPEDVTERKDCLVAIRQLSLELHKLRHVSITIDDWDVAGETMLLVLDYDDDFGTKKIFGELDAEKQLFVLSICIRYCDNLLSFMKKTTDGEHYNHLRRGWSVSIPPHFINLGDLSTSKTCGVSGSFSRR